MPAVVTCDHQNNGATSSNGKEKKKRWMQTQSQTRGEFLRMAPGDWAAREQTSETMAPTSRRE